MDLKKHIASLDYWIIIAVCILSIFGIICIGSATHINLGESMSTFYSQIAWFIIGIGLLIFASQVDYEFFSNFYKTFYIINIVLLIAVLIIGREVNGAKRWIYIGPASIQPSEFTKIIMIFCLAKFIVKNKYDMHRIPTLIKICVFALVPVILIQAQPSLSASLVSIAVLLIELFLAGLSFKIIYRCLAVGIPSIGLILWDISRENHLFVDKIFQPHQISRIEAFIYPEKNPDTYYQTLKSISAIGSGQLHGKGIYEGTLNQLSYLPEPHNDFIFSVIGEEFGFIGCVFVLALLIFIIFRCIIIALSARDLFSQLIVSGIAGMFAFQTFVNAGVATGIMPNTGMPLPFVSYGGSSMWMNMLSIGLVLNIGLKNSKSLFEGV